MDYTDIPRSLIYKDRTDLSDFGVDAPGTLNHHLYTQMERMTLLDCGDAEEIALQCFNNAYYICTLIQLLKRPQLKMDKFEQRLMEVEIPFKGDVYQASMAMVCVLLGAYDDEYKQKDHILIYKIHHWTASNKWVGSNCHNSFDNIIMRCRPNGFFLPQNVFAPRDIIEVIETCSVSDLQDYAEYICERLALLSDSSKRMYGADTAIARIRDYQRELCEDSGYSPRKDSFNYMDEAYSIRNRTWENKVRDYYQQSKEAIEYYDEHYQKIKEGVPQQVTQIDVKPEALQHSSEISCLQERIKTLSDENKRLQTELSEAQAKIKELMQPVEDLTAEQKVRMAFTLQLLIASGLTEEKISQNKSKVAKIIHLVTEIGANNNGKYPSTQICQNWLTERHYYPERNNKTLIELNTLCGGLGLNNVYLSLGPKGAD